MASSDCTAAVIYTRLSRESKGADVTLERQERECRARAEVEGLPVRAVYSEGAGRSAFGQKARPVFEEMLASLQAGDLVITWAVDRFSRDTEAGLGHLRAIRRHGAEFLTLDGEDSRRDPSNLPFTVRLAVAEHESETKKRRILASKADARRLGLWMGGKPPYGWCIETDEDGNARPQIDEEQADVVRRIVADVIDGKSLSRIARKLTDEGIPTPKAAYAIERAKREGRPRPDLIWRAGAISSIIRSPHVVGHAGSVRRGTDKGPDGKPIRMTPPIVSEGEQRAALRALEGRSSDALAGKSKPGAKPKALLSGLLVCSLCQHAEDTSRSPALHRTGKNYQCTNAGRNGRCDGCSVYAPTVERLVTRRALSFLASLDPSDPQSTEADHDILFEIASRWLAHEEPANAAEVEAARAEVADARAALADLEEARYVRGEFSDAEGGERYDRLHRTLSNRVREAEEVAAALNVDTGPPDISPLLDMVHTAEWFDVDPEDEDAVRERREFLGVLLDRVEVLPIPEGTKRGQRFQPERLVFRWASSAAASEHAA